MTFEGRETTFGQLDRRASRVANGLLATCATAQARVAVLDKNSDQFFELLFGAAKARDVLVPVNWRLAPAEIAYIVNDAEAEVLFVGEEYVATRRAAPARAADGEADHRAGRRPPGVGGVRRLAGPPGERRSAPGHARRRRRAPASTPAARPATRRAPRSPTTTSWRRWPLPASGTTAPPRASTWPACRSSTSPVASSV